MEKSPDPAAQTLKHNLHNLQTRWDNVMSRANERRDKLQEAVTHAESFHDDLQKLIAWLTNTEKTLNNLKPVSRVVDTVKAQIDEHQVCSIPHCFYPFVIKACFFPDLIS